MLTRINVTSSALKPKQSPKLGENSLACLSTFKKKNTKAKKNPTKTKPKNCDETSYFHAINEDVAFIVIVPYEPRFLQIFSTILAAVLIITSLSFIFSVLY